MAYLCVAAPALMLVKTGAFASPVYPAAGLALACVLRFGLGASVGVFLGALAANVGLAWLAGRPMSGMPAAFALGAALQSVAGAALVKRLMGSHPSLTRPREIARFSLVGCAVGCLVSATVATAAIAFARWPDAPGADPVALEGLASTWWTWYSGDAFGALVGAPVVLTLVGLPRHIWRSRRATVAAPLLAVTLLLGWATARINVWEDQRAGAAFERDVTNAAGSIEAHLRRHLDALTAMHGVFEGERPVSRLLFERAAEPWLRSLPSLQALGFLEQIERENLKAREAAIAAQDGRDFHVFLREPEIAVGDAFVLSVRFIEPMSRNARALGVNSLSISEPRKALLQTLQSGAPVASGPFRLTQESGVQTGVVVYQRVRGTEGQQGVAFATLRMGDALADMTAKLPRSLEYCLLDQGRELMAGSPRCASWAPGARRMYSTSIAQATRQWELRIVAAADAPVYGTGLRADLGTASVFAASGMVACGMLGTLLLLLTGRAREIELTVRQRTRQVLELRSENRQSESALRSTEERFKVLFDKVPVGVVFASKDGVILQPNACYCELLGYTEQQLRGKSVLDITPAEDVAVDRARRAALVDNGGQLRYVKRYVRADGQLVQARVTATVLPDAQGRPDITVSLVEDMSEQLHLEEAQRARAVAEAANRAKTEFLSRMSHELRTPLNAVLGFAQLLSLDRSLPFTEKHQGWLKQMQDAGWHLLQLIDDVLDLSRVEAGAVALTNTPVDLASLLGSAVAMIESEARKRQVHVQVLPPPGGDDRLFVLADVTRLRQVLINVLSNAIKYNRPGGHVSIETVAERPGWVTITVTDSGLGMSPAQLQRLFRPFDRLGRESSNVAGAGIGLYITKLLVERMRGEVRVRSDEGQGTSFAITLPMAELAGASPETAADTAPPVRPYNARQVLLIEDNSDNIDVISAMLALRPQIALRVSRDGRGGLAAAKSRPPDLVLLDLRLPDISGMAVLEALRASPVTQDLPVVVLSASADHDQVALALRQGAQAFLPKPVEAKRLLALLDEMLSSVDTDLGDLH